MEFRKLLLISTSLISSTQFVPAYAMVPALAHKRDVFSARAGIVMSLELQSAVEDADLATVKIISSTLNLAQLELVIAYAQEILEQFLFVVLENQSELVQAEIVELGIKYTRGLLTISQAHRLTSLLDTIASAPDLAAELTIGLTGVAPVTILRNSLNILKFLQDSQKAIIARDAIAA
jgi:hypothetical protein